MHCWGCDFWFRLTIKECSFCALRPVSDLNSMCQTGLIGSLSSEYSVILNAEVIQGTSSLSGPVIFAVAVVHDVAPENLQE